MGTHDLEKTSCLLYECCMYDWDQKPAKNPNCDPDLTIDYTTNTGLRKGLRKAWPGVGVLTSNYRYVTVNALSSFLNLLEPKPIVMDGFLKVRITCSMCHSGRASHE
jgi:hypothetical protein